jgi:hypothetical protein
MTAIDVTSEPPGKFVSAVWVEERKTLRLVLQSLVLARTKISILVPGGPTGLVIPDNGVATNLPSLRVETDTVSGPVPGTSIATTVGVGSFSETPALEYAPAQVDTDTAVSISFTAAMTLRVQDTISFSLAGFSRTGGDYNDASSHPQFDVRWTDAAQMLTLSARSTLNPEPSTFNLKP